MVKTIITRKNDNVITNIVDTTEVVSNGLKVTDGNGEYIIGFINECDVFEGVETTDDIKPQEYKYDVLNGFTKNPNYIPYISPEEENKQLKEKLVLMQQALDELLLGGM